MRTPLIALIAGLLLATTGFATAAVVSQNQADLPASVAQSTNGGGSRGQQGGGASANANGNGSNGNLANTGLGVGGLVLAGGILVGSGVFVRRRAATADLS